MMTSIIPCVVGGCSSSPAEPPTSAATQETTPSPPLRKSEVPSDEGTGSETGRKASAPSSEKEGADEKNPVRFADGVFPPPDPGAPFERSKKEGDGVWRPVFGESPDLALDKRAESDVDANFAVQVAQRLVLHPHETSKFQKLTIAAFDLRHLSLAHLPGAQDVKDVKRAELEEKAGVVPESERGDLLAVFNGGFQPRHGRWGMLSLGEQLIPVRDDACTVAVTKDSALRIGLWPRMKDDEEIVGYRQTPPCLVIDGAIHPKLAQGDRRKWAGQQEKRKTRRRSAVGVSKDGRTLFYALGTETEPETLAAGLLHAGAHQAAQLDINWNWTRLFFFQESDGEVKPVGALEEHMAKDKGEYIYRRGKRGFFYLVRRPTP